MPTRMHTEARTQFMKTRMCASFAKGRCPYGANCKFAHSKNEVVSQPNLEKTKLCPQWKRSGECSAGAECVYAHGTDELRTTGTCFKSKLCAYHTKGKCTFGDSCRYAHGAHELRGANGGTSLDALSTVSTVDHSCTPETSSDAGSGARSPVDHWTESVRFSQPVLQALGMKANTPAELPGAQGKVQLHAARTFTPGGAGLSWGQVWASASPSLVPELLTLPPTWGLVSVEDLRRAAPLLYED